MCNRERLVYLTEERVFGYIVGAMGAYYTMIRYNKSGIEHEVFVENDEFELMEEDTIERDSDG